MTTSHDSTLQDLTKWTVSALGDLDDETRAALVARLNAGLVVIDWAAEAMRVRSTIRTFRNNSDAEAALDPPDEQGRVHFTLAVRGAAVEFGHRRLFLELTDTCGWLVPLDATIIELPGSAGVSPTDALVILHELSRP